MRLKKLSTNPIIEPRQKNKWEAWQTFNPAAILLDNNVHFLYRAIGENCISCLGYASSKDGFTINKRLSYPVFKHNSNNSSFNTYFYSSGGSWGGAEDPRIVRVGKEDRLYMTYTACDNGLRVALTSIKLDDFLNKRWKWEPSVFLSSPDEVHKNWVIFPEKINNKYAILHSISPEIAIDYFDSLEFDNSVYINSYYNCELRKNCWDSWVRGAGAPPIKTKYGWLIFYHAMDDDWTKYKVGALLLDLKDPTKEIARSLESVLEPDKKYENNGFKAGIVYVSGAVVKNGKLLVYYGCSDSYVGVAYANLDEFLEALMKKTKPKLKHKINKKTK